MRINGSARMSSSGRNERRNLCTKRFPRERTKKRTKKDVCERRTCGRTKALNEGAFHERRKPTNDETVNERRTFSWTKAADERRTLARNEGTNVPTKNLRNLLFDERRNPRTNEGPTNVRRTFLNPHIGITLYFILYALLYFLCYGYTCKCIVYYYTYGKENPFVLSLGRKEGRSCIYYYGYGQK